MASIFVSERLRPKALETAMAHYRLYFMNADTCHIDRGEDLEAIDDADAVTAARTRIGRQPIELWRGGHKVHRIEKLSTESSDNQRLFSREIASTA